MTYPDPKNIDKFKLYNLHDLGWTFDNTEESIKDNAPIKEDIAQDFADYSKLTFEDVFKVFEIDYIHNNYRTTEGILVLYTNKGSSDVKYHFTNPNTGLYKELR